MGSASRPAYKNPDSWRPDNKRKWREEGEGWSELEDEADALSATYLTSAEEYPDDEYLDMSKSSSLKPTNKKKANVSSLFVCLCGKKCVNVCVCVHLSVSRATKGFSSGLWSKEE